MLFRYIYSTAPPRVRWLSVLRVSSAIYVNLDGSRRSKVEEGQQSSYYTFANPDEPLCFVDIDNIIIVLVQNGGNNCKSDDYIAKYLFKFKKKWGDKVYGIYSFHSIIRRRKPNWKKAVYFYQTVFSTLYYKEEKILSGSKLVWSYRPFIG